MPRGRRTGNGVLPPLPRGRRTGNGVLPPLPESNGRNGTAHESELHHIALRYLLSNLSVIPIRGDGSKRPAMEEGNPVLNRLRQATQEELHTWFVPNFAGGVGILGGKTSANLLVLDFEYVDFWNEFAALVEAEKPGLIARLPQVKTPGKDAAGGRHLYVRTKGEPPGNLKLARISPEEAQARTGDRGKTTAIETRGQGGYVVAPGSPAACHDSGRTWEHLAGPDLTETPVLEPDELETLLRCARALDRRRVVEEEAAAAQSRQERRSRASGCLAGERPGDHFNRDGSWEEAFGASGWKKDRLRGDAQYWTRPGKDKGVSASSGRCSTQQSGELLYVFTSNAEPLEDGRGYNKFSVYAHLQHGGDFHKAAQSLKAIGYCSDRQKQDQEKREQKQVQEEEDAEALADLLDQIDGGVGLAIRFALSIVSVLARLKRNDSSRYELVLLELRDAGATSRDMQGLERSVNQTAKGLKQDARRASKAASARDRSQRQAKQPGLCNYFDVEDAGGEGEVRTLRLGHPLPRISEQLTKLTPGWPKRIDNVLFVEGQGHKPLWLDAPAGLFAWIGSQMPADATRNPIVWGTGPDLASEKQFHSYLGQTAERYSDLERFPHEPMLERHYYMHPTIEGGNGKHFQELLAFFCPATDIDADLIRAFFLTLFWGGRAGSRPAFLFTGQADDLQGGRGIGKTTIPQLAAHLAGGYVSLSTGDKFSDLLTRVLSEDAAGKRIVLLDNLKSLRLSWAELESLITTKEISGRRLYHGEGSRPNHFLVCLTVNGASVSKDLAQRCVVIELKRPAYSKDWQQQAEDFIDSHRWSIVGDILAELRQQPRELKEHSRWGLWEGEVLCRASPEPADALKAIDDRRKEADDDDAEADMVRDAFEEELRGLEHDPDKEVVFIPSRIAAGWVNGALGEKRSTPRACAFLNALTIRELRRAKLDRKQRGYLWRGVSAPPGTTPTPLRKGSNDKEKPGTERTQVKAEEVVCEWIKLQLANGPKRVQAILQEGQTAKGYDVNCLYTAMRALKINEYSEEGRKWWRLHDADDESS